MGQTFQGLFLYGTLEPKRGELAIDSLVGEVVNPLGVEFLPHEVYSPKSSLYADDVGVIGVAPMGFQRLDCAIAPKWLDVRFHYRH